MKNLPFIVSLAGPDTVGKGTTANGFAALAAQHGVKVEVHAFANKLYECTAIIMGLSVAEIKRRKGEVLTEETAPLPFMVGKTFRWFLRKLGTDACRDHIDWEIWIQAAQRVAQIAKQERGADVVIFDDCRFPNEAGVSGVVIELSRVGVSYSDEHASAQGLPPEVPRIHLAIDQGPEYAAKMVLEIVGEARGRLGATA